MAGRPALVASLACCLLLQPHAARAADDVVIYRCTDARGHLTLRDSPCPKGQAQETRSMLRPKDAPPAPMRPVARTRAVESAPAPTTTVERVVVMQPPRPLYECVTPDGGRYTSETPEGNPRWVPLWTLGVPVAPYPQYPGVIGDTSLAITHGNVHITAGRTVITPPVYGPAAYGAGTWIRDTCHPLPQAEVCARLRDRRDEVDRRFFNAQPSERERLAVEERGINARLAQDCR